MAINIIIRNPFDLDAREYFARATITDSLAKKQINEFVRGVKNMGLWGNMTCWPLRANQNAGTGTKAYSLGSDTKDGTLVNGPAWGAGLVFNGGTQLLDAGTVDMPSPCAFIAVCHATTTVNYERIVGFNNALNRSVYTTRMSNDYYIEFCAYDTGVVLQDFRAYSTALQNIIYYSARVETNSLLRCTYTNSGRISTAAKPGRNWGDKPTNIDLKIGSYTSMAMTLYFAAIVKGAVISDSTDSALYTLIQNTIGNGLTIL